MSVREKKVTFDCTLEIIRIILELRSQILKSALDADIIRIIAASKKMRIILIPSRFYDRIIFTITKINIHICLQEFYQGALSSWVLLTKMLSPKR